MFVCVFFPKLRNITSCYRGKIDGTEGDGRITEAMSLNRKEEIRSSVQVRVWH